MKEGKKPLTDDELKAKLSTQRDDTQQYDEAKKKLDEAERVKDESVKNLIESTLSAQKQNEDRLKLQIKSDQFKHYLALGGFMVIWVAFIIYSNMQ